MKKFERIKDNIDGFRDESTLVKNTTTEEYYVVSSVHLMPSLFDIVLPTDGHDSETYIFPSDKDGNVHRFVEVYGVRPRDHEGIIEKLLKGEIDFEEEVK